MMNHRKLIPARQYIPPDSVQWIENIGDSDLKFLCMVYPPWSEKDE